MSIALTMIGSIPTFAKESKDSVKENKVDKGQTISISDSDFDTMLSTKKPIYLGDMTWAEVIMPDEMVSHIAERRGISEEEAKQQLPNSTLKTSSSILDTSSTMSITTTSRSYYVHFYKSFEVSTTGWYPTLDVYVECQGYNRDFISIYDLNLISSYNYIYKTYVGKCEAKVQSTKSIYWVVHGTFYNTGTSTSSIKVGVDIKCLNLEYSSTNATGIFGYVYRTELIENRTTRD